MCRYEVYGDLYQGCGCFKKSYYSGERTDCGKADCRNSEKHTHRAPLCPCGAYAQDEKRIMNLFRFACDDCKRDEFQRRVGR
ncbi:hypothetical protein M378DRAFT_106153 [Amanita muscaria Koide BX008]|uniref:Uncharacterized protein n=1 Tax=Amanita muscaria (strain Koide BX008) TaxID=946122 RepID=A0A0C2X5D4_AMAMK|nr:hypothetical protein M378DRAFT_106153 [Amanita muscaria Koide BX008]